MNRKTAFALVLGLVALTGAWILKISTPFGLGLTDDAISYIAASRALLVGQGFTRIWLATGLEPITHWPPAFSATLALLSFILKIDPYRSARILNGLVFGANAALLALLGYKMTKFYIAGIFLSALFLLNTAFLRLHAQALSEPLYIFISLLAFLTFVRAFQSEKSETSQKKWLVITGILTGISYLTRYAALSLIATFIVAIFILRPTWKKRFVSLAYFLAGLLPFTLAWMLRNELVGGTATNRMVIWHPLTLENTQRGLKSFFQFTFPFFNKPDTFILAIIPFLLSIALFIWVVSHGLKHFLKPEEHAPFETLPFVTTLYIFSYMGSLLVSLSFFDAATPLNDRILSPVYLALLVMLVYFIHRLFEQGKIVTRILAISLALFLLTTSVFAQTRTVKELQESAMGFASWRWQESTVMEAIRNLPEDVEIYTNQPPAVYFWTDRPVYPIWGSKQSETIRSGDAVLAIFYTPNRETAEFQGWLDEITDGLAPIQKSGLGNLYRKPQ